jgi:hypothetical protein
MSSVLRLYPSDVWLADLIVLCQNFQKRFSEYPGGRFLVFLDEYIGIIDKLGTVDKPGKIVKEYHKSVDKLKEKIFGSHANIGHIDYHKIAALYILSFLKYKPFCLDIPNETKNPRMSWRVKLANEYFSIAFLEAVFKAGNKTIDKELKIDKKYESEFIKMLYEHKQNKTKLEPLTFAHVIYQIEQKYFLTSV